MIRFIHVLVMVLMAVFAGFSSAEAADPRTMGVVIMHGKGGSPNGLVAGLAAGLEGKGYLVANLEMPWSGNRHYDVGVAGAEAEVAAALKGLQEKGAHKLFIAGHSQGGVFTMHVAGKVAVHGVIAISPGGNVGNQGFRTRLGEFVVQAGQMKAEGRGGETTTFYDYEGSRGFFPVRTTPEIYLTWFDPEGAMNLEKSVKAIKPGLPVLWIVARNDYPQLRQANIPMFQTLPAHPLTKLFEPDADHKGSPNASLEEIVRWIGEVADAPAQ